MSWIDEFLKAVNLVLNNGAPMPRRQTINFAGSGVAIVDNPAQQRTDITINGGGGGSGSALGDVVGPLSATTVIKINGATAPNTPGSGDTGKFIVVTGVGAYGLGSGGGGSGGLVRQSLHLNLGALQAGAPGGTYNIGAILPSNSVVMQVTLNVATALASSAGGYSQSIGQVGISPTYDDIMSGVHCEAPARNHSTINGFFGNGNGSDYGGQQMTLQVVPDAGTVGDLTSGDLTVSIIYSVLT